MFIDFCIHTNTTYTPKEHSSRQGGGHVADTQKCLGDSMMLVLLPCTTVSVPTWPRQSVPVLTYVSWRCSELGMMDCLVTHPQLLPPPPPPRLSTTGAVHSVCASLTSRVCVSLVNTAIIPPTTRRLYNLQRSDISWNFRKGTSMWALVFFFSFLWTRENQNYKRVSQETSPTNLKWKTFIYK